MIPANVTDRDVAEWLEQRAKALPVGKMLEKDAMKLAARALNDVARWEKLYGPMVPSRPAIMVTVSEGALPLMLAAPAESPALSGAEFGLANSTAQPAQSPEPPVESGP